MYVKGISCKYKEYRFIDNKWRLVNQATEDVTLDIINNMVCSQGYFSNLGGYMSIDYKTDRNFGLVCDKIVSISICKTIKKVYKFDYSKAR